MLTTRKEMRIDLYSLRARLINQKSKLLPEILRCSAKIDKDVIDFENIISLEKIRGQIDNDIAMLDTYLALSDHPD